MQRNPYINCPTIEQIIDRAPLQIPPDSSVLEAISLLSRGQEGSCVLVVEGTRLVGIFTERKAIELTSAGIDLAKTEIVRVIEQPAISLTLSDSQTVLGALSLMRSQRIRHLPVVDESGKLIGLITQDRIYEAIDPLETVEESGACESKETELQEIISALQILIGIDISDRKQAEIALKESEQRLRY
jgi:CBS domain-containing protein